MPFIKGYQLRHPLFYSITSELPFLYQRANMLLVIRLVLISRFFAFLIHIMLIDLNLLLRINIKQYKYLVKLETAQGNGVLTIYLCICQFWHTTRAQVTPQASSVLYVANLYFVKQNVFPKSVLVQYVLISLLYDITTYDYYCSTAT